MRVLLEGKPQRRGGARFVRDLFTSDCAEAGSAAPQVSLEWAGIGIGKRGKYLITKYFQVELRCLRTTISRGAIKGLSPGCTTSVPGDRYRPLVDVWFPLASRRSWPAPAGHTKSALGRKPMARNRADEYIRTIDTA
jgi:hypothetical protein